MDLRSETQMPQTENHARRQAEISDEEWKKLGSHLLDELDILIDRMKRLLPENVMTKLEVYDQLRQMHSILKSIPDREDNFEQVALDAVDNVLYLAEGVFSKDDE